MDEREGLKAALVGLQADIAEISRETEILVNNRTHAYKLVDFFEKRVSEQIHKLIVARKKKLDIMHKLEGVEERT